MSFTRKTRETGLVHEMLVAGVIQPSLSPYSSSAILVRKKDSSWRFCVDRALSNIIVPDKYLIPIIEELIDKLHEGEYFLKIDLHSGYHQIKVKLDNVYKMAF